MVFGIREIGGIVADKIVRPVQIHRQRILDRMVNRPPQADHCIFSGMERERLAVSRELPNGLYDRNECRKDDFSRIFVPGYERIDTSGIIWGHRSETQAVEILHLVIVVVQDKILVGLIVSLLRKFLAAPRNRFPL